LPIMCGGLWIVSDHMLMHSLHPTAATASPTPSIQPTRARFRPPQSVRSPPHPHPHSVLYCWSVACRVQVASCRAIHRTLQRSRYSAVSVERSDSHARSSPSKFAVNHLQSQAGNAPHTDKAGFRKSYCDAPKTTAVLPKAYWTMNTHAIDGAVNDSYRFNPCMSHPVKSSACAHFTCRVPLVSWKLRGVGDTADYLESRAARPNAETLHQVDPNMLLVGVVSLQGVLPGQHP
jgi:hypothetical protein